MQLALDQHYKPVFYLTAALLCTISAFVPSFQVTLYLWALCAFILSQKPPLLSSISWNKLALLTLASLIPWLAQMQPEVVSQQGFHTIGLKVAISLFTALTLGFMLTFLYTIIRFVVLDKWNVEDAFNAHWRLGTLIKIHTFMINGLPLATTLALPLTQAPVTLLTALSLYLTVVNNPLEPH